MSCPRHPLRVPWSVRSLTLGWVVATVLLLSACEGAEPVPDHVARVGDRYLTSEELSTLLRLQSVGTDTAEARMQIVEEWVKNELLAQEAVRLGLRSDPEVQQRLEENERSVLIGSLIERLYEELEATPSQSEIEAYYMQHANRLVLREPYVRVRYLHSKDAQVIQSARQRLIEATASTEIDSLWPVIADQFAVDPGGSIDLADHYYPQSRLFAEPALDELLDRLTPGEVTPVVEAEGQYHVFQVVDRIPAGTEPQLSMIENELRRSLIIESRKQMISRHVQRLRNEALAREDLELRL